MNGPGRPRYSQAMAFCNLTCSCGTGCLRSDDHGGGHDCYRADCPTAMCPDCGHANRRHHDHGGRGPTWYRCWERESDENNDFCGCVHGRPEPLRFTLYVVRDLSGRYYRPRKGRGSRKEPWTDDVLEARFFTSISSARGRVSYMQNHHPTKYLPHVEAFVAIHEGSVDETTYLKEAKERDLRKAEALRRLTVEREKREIDTLRMQMKQISEQIDRKLRALEGTE